MRHGQIKWAVSRVIPYRPRASTRWSEVERGFLGVGIFPYVIAKFLKLEILIDAFVIRCYYIFISRVILLGMFNDWLVIYHEAIPLLVYRLILRQPTSITTHGRCVGCDLSIRCKDLENNISLDCLVSLCVVLLVFLSFFFYLMF